MFPLNCTFDFPFILLDSAVNLAISTTWLLVVRCSPLLDPYTAACRVPICRNSKESDLEVAPRKTLTKTIQRNQRCPKRFIKGSFWCSYDDGGV